jgi:hypothetical protein
MTDDPNASLPITLPCGCEVGREHYCRPPWMTAEEWARWSR